MIRIETLTRFTMIHSFTFSKKEEIVEQREDFEIRLVNTSDADHIRCLCELLDYRKVR